MDWTAFVSGLIGGGFGSTIVGVLLKTWLDRMLRSEAARFAEERELLNKRREASTAVADIVAEWTRPTYTEKFSNEDRWRLQTSYWKNIMWLDKELLDLVLPALARAPGAAGSHELIVQARRVLLGLREPDISADQLNTWSPK